VWGASDAYGDHLLCCQQNGIVKRHNAIVDHLARVTKAAGLPYTVDRAIDVDHRQRPGDLILPRWQGVSPLYIDVTITHPLALSNNWASIRSGGEELLRSEDAKRSKYINILPQQDQLVVFGMTTFGQLSEGAENFLHDLAAMYSSAAPTAEEAEEDLEYIQQQLQLCLQRQIARMLLTAFVPEAGEFEVQ